MALDGGREIDACLAQRVGEVDRLGSRVREWLPARRNPVGLEFARDRAPFPSYSVFGLAQGKKPRSHRATACIAADAWSGSLGAH